MNKNDENNKLDQILELVIEASTERKQNSKRTLDLEKYMTHLGSQIIKAEQQGVAKIRETADIVNDHVHQKPWAYVAGAAAGGLLIGLICGRRT